MPLSSFYSKMMRNQGFDGAIFYANLLNLHIKFRSSFPDEIKLQNSILLNNFNKVLMDSNWLKPNVFVIQNGKLVPRPNTPEQKKNYRYIHYDPLNNPSSDDYFRETISRLQKQNTNLKNQLAKIIQETVDRPMLSAQDHNLQLIRSLQEQVAALKLELGRKQQQIMEKNHQLTQKDKQILEISNENTRLHLRINSVVKQIEALNKVMSRKDEQILNKKEQIQQYCRTLEKFTVKEKDEQTTMFSDNFQMTPKIEEKIQEEQDEFFSADTSNFDMVSMDRRFMTPQIQSFRIEDRNQYFHMTQQQRPIEDSKKSESSRQNKLGERIISSFRNSLWSNQVKQASSLETQASSRVSYVGQDRR